MYIHRMHRIYISAVSMCQKLYVTIEVPKQGKYVLNVDTVQREMSRRLIRKHLVEEEPPRV